MLIARHTSALPAGTAGSVPEWVHLVPAGTFKGVDGRGPYQLNDAQAVISASMAGGDIPLDENHSTDAAAPNGQPSPARAWIDRMEARPDGIWGHAVWNESGRQLMADKAYKGISPVFSHDAKGNVLRVLRAALTNNPNLADLASLHTQQETGVDLTKLRAALGLPEIADEAAILAAATTAHTALAAHAQHLTDIAKAAGVAATDAAGIVTAIQAVRATGSDVQAMAAKVVTLETALNAVNAERAKEKAAAFVDGAIAAGKPLASLRDHYIARHQADAAAVEKEVAAMTSVNAGGMSPRGGTPFTRHDAADGDDLTAEEMAACEKMNLDPAKFKEHKAKMAKKKEA